MKDNYKVLGDYIEPVDERNKDLFINNLLGVSISKRFIPSIANIIGTDLSNYKIVRTGQFAYGPVTSRNGEKVSIAFLNEDDCIISSSYSVFKVTDIKQLNPQYLMLWFSRPEFDRYARYKSHGSVREIFDWDELCQVELPVPHIDKQKDIVKAYNIISDRIELKRKINDNLVAQMRAYFKEFASHIEQSSVGKLKDHCSMQYGYTETATNEPIGSKFLRITDIAQPYIDWSAVPYCPITEENHKKYVLSEGDIVIARTGATVGVAKMLGTHIPDAVFASFLVRIRPNDEDYKYYFGLMITSPEFLDFVQTNAGGSAQPQANPPLLGEYEISIPDKQTLSNFNSRILCFLNAIESNEREISKLNEAKVAMIEMLSSH